MLKVLTDEKLISILCSSISARYILTAAHCINRRSDLPSVVRLGEHVISKPIDCEIQDDDSELCTPPVQDIRVEKIMPHVQYSNKKGKHDIGLIRLTKDADFSKFAVIPICLPTTPGPQSDVGKDYIITGWGTTEIGSKSDILQKAKIPGYEFSQCKVTYSRAGQDLFEGHLCAGGIDNVDSCKGDSGKKIFKFAMDVRGTN